MTRSHLLPLLSLALIPGLSCACPNVGIEPFCGVSVAFKNEGLLAPGRWQIELSVDEDLITCTFLQPSGSDTADTGEVVEPHFSCDDARADCWMGSTIGTRIALSELFIEEQPSHLAARVAHEGEILAEKRFQPKYREPLFDPCNETCGSDRVWMVVPDPGSD